MHPLYLSSLIVATVVAFWVSHMIVANSLDKNIQGPPSSLYVIARSAAEVLLFLVESSIPLSLLNFEFFFFFRDCKWLLHEMGEEFLQGFKLVEKAVIRAVISSPLVIS